MSQSFFSNACSKISNLLPNRELLGFVGGTSFLGIASASAGAFLQHRSLSSMRDACINSSIGSLLTWGTILPTRRFGLIPEDTAIFTALFATPTLSNALGYLLRSPWSAKGINIKDLAAATAAPQYLNVVVAAALACSYAFNDLTRERDGFKKERDGFKEKLDQTSDELNQAEDDWVDLNIKNTQLENNLENLQAQHNKTLKEKTQLENNLEKTNEAFTLHLVTSAIEEEARKDAKK